MGNMLTQLFIRRIGVIEDVDVIAMAQSAQVKWLRDHASISYIEVSAIVACVEMGQTGWMADDVLVHFSRK